MIEAQPAKCSAFSLEEVKKLSEKYKIAEEHVPRIKYLLDNACAAAKALQPRSDELKPSEIRGDLRELSKAITKFSHTHLRHLHNDIQLGIAFSYKRELYLNGSIHGDPEEQAGVQLQQDLEAIRRLQRHIKWTERWWNRHPRTKSLVGHGDEITAIENELPAKGHSKPHAGIIVAVIYRIWVELLGRPWNASAELVGFAEAVHRLCGEPGLTVDAIRDRLKNTAYLDFIKTMRMTRARRIKKLL